METAQLDIDHAKELSPMPRTNVGYLAVSNKEKVVLCFGDILDKENARQVWDGVLVIPRRIITSIKELTP